jgi:hypothetical protein
MKQNNQGIHIKMNFQEENGLNSQKIFCAFHTTLTYSKKCQNKGILTTIKPFMCIPRTSQAYKKRNHEFSPFFMKLNTSSIHHIKGGSC